MLSKPKFKPCFECVSLNLAHNPKVKNRSDNHRHDEFHIIKPNFYPLAFDFASVAKLVYRLIFHHPAHINAAQKGCKHEKHIATDEIKAVKNVFSTYDFNVAPSPISKYAGQISKHKNPAQS